MPRRHPPHAPIGPRMTEALRIVGRCGVITTVGVAERLWPPADDGRPRPPHQREVAHLFASSAAIRAAGLLLEKMKLRGLVRRAHPWTGGKLWALGIEGCALYAQISKQEPACPAQRKRRRFRTDRVRRIKAKNRRAARPVGSCVNENLRRSHGPATKGCRCDGCHDIHRRTA